MGQYIQQGERMLMETVVRFAPAEQQMVCLLYTSHQTGKAPCALSVKITLCKKSQVLFIFINRE